MARFRNSATASSTTWRIRCQIAQGDSTRAIAEFRQALRIAPTFAQADLDLGKALAATGDTASALDYLQKAAAGSDPAARDQARKLIESLKTQPH